MKTVKIEPSKKMMKIFNLAKTMAEQNNTDKFRHGAVLVSGSTIINCATNLNRPCSFGIKFRHPDLGTATGHSELLCILNVPKQSTNNSDVFVVRVNSLGEWRNSAPCQMCQMAMKFVGIKRVYFSDNDGFKMVKL